MAHPTNSISPTDQAFKTATPSSPVVTTTPLPEMTSDLLYLTDGKLMRWDHVTDYSSLLASGVEKFAVSESGKKVALIKTTNITANGVELFILAILDFDTKQITNLIENAPPLSAISISADGKWIAYTTDAGNANIIVINTDDGEQIFEAGTCTREDDGSCNKLAWSPDGKNLLWTDDRGIWNFNVESGSSHLLHTNVVRVTDPKGGEGEVSVQFDSLTWSPRGRYVLMEVIPSDSGVRWQGILDTKNGRFAQVPNSFDYSTLDACACWSKDGSLMVGHSGDSAEDRPPYINIWGIVPTHNDLLILEENFELDSQFFPSLSNLDEFEQHYFPNWLSQINENKSYFGLTLIDTNSSPLLFELDLRNGTLSEIIVIPYNPIDVLWSPDGVGALIIGKNSEIIFAPFDGSLMRDLHLRLGEDAQDFIWLPPTPRS
jgi:Tol biopolymer transport system component